METEVDIFEERLNKIDIEDFEGIWEKSEAVSEQ
jgi:hypothetical protein